MPARKPAALHKRHSTKREKSARAASESASAPKTQLTTRPPDRLKGHRAAIEVWKRLIGLYAETQGTMITAFDEDVLVKYCLAEEDLQELFLLRAQIKKLWTAHTRLLKTLKPTAKNLKEYFGALMQANALLQRYQGMDARMDGKRKLVFSLAQSLYLTPRARAGVAPAPKAKEEPEDEMDQLLDD